MDTLEIIREMQRDEALRASLQAVLLDDEVRDLPNQVRLLTANVDQLVEVQKKTEISLAELVELSRQHGDTFQQHGDTFQQHGDALTRLENTVAELTEAQKATDATVKELAESSKRHEDTLNRLEKTVAELTEAQKATDATVKELAEAQKATDATVKELVEALRKTDRKLDNLASEVGHLSQLLGGTVEDDAASMVRYALQSRGYALLSDPVAVGVNGEIDVVTTARDPSGRTLSVLIEAKTRLRVEDVRRFAAKLNGLAHSAGITGPYFGYLYGFRIYQGAEEAARDTQLGLLHYTGEKVEPVEQVA
ncbi:MAG: hypothetical protein ACYDGY_04215 [Acidimicrobiales bacterium]